MEAPEAELVDVAALPVLPVTPACTRGSRGTYPPTGLNRKPDRSPQRRRWPLHSRDPTRNRNPTRNRKPGLQPEPEPQSEPPKPESWAEPKARSEPAPQPDPEAGQGTLPVSDADWPTPTDEELQAANGTRRYDLPPSTIMGPTTKDLELHGVPVINSDS